MNYQPSSERRHVQRPYLHGWESRPPWQETGGRRKGNRRSRKPSTRDANRPFYLCLAAAGFTMKIASVLILLSCVVVEASAWQQTLSSSLALQRTSTTATTRTFSKNSFIAAPARDAEAALLVATFRAQMTRMSSIRGGGGGGGSSSGGGGLQFDNSFVSSTSSPSTSPSSSQLAVSSSMQPTSSKDHETQHQFMQSSTLTETSQSSSLSISKSRISLPVAKIASIGAKKHGGLILSIPLLLLLLLGSSVARMNVAAVITSLFASYRNSLIHYPLTSKVLTGATLAIVGDAIAQYTTWLSSSRPSSPISAPSSSSMLSTSATEKVFSYDYRRALSFATFDACYRVFQNTMFPAVISLCKGLIVKQLIPIASTRVAAAVERTLLYQLVIVPVRFT